MKKIKILLGICGVVVLGGIITYAINTWMTGYKIEKGGGKVKITNYNACFRNDDLHNSYFIPTKTSLEFNEFKKHKPSVIKEVSCKTQYYNGVSSWEIRYKGKDRTSAFPRCGTLAINRLFVKTPFGNYQRSSHNIRDLTNIRSVIINGRVVERGDLVSNNAGACKNLYPHARRIWKVKY